MTYGPDEFFVNCPCTQGRVCTMGMTPKGERGPTQDRLHSAELHLDQLTKGTKALAEVLKQDLALHGKVVYKTAYKVGVYDPLNR